ncbi:hypothetical protein BASA81_008307 [Batrachochytrium salamandrivorans]|nr:hypothetical protein BASA81_008307 [Batrachochytrium salamandrivorans]
MRQNKFLLLSIALCVLPWLAYQHSWYQPQVVMEQPEIILSPEVAEPREVEAVAPTKVQTVAPSKVQTVAPTKVETVAPTKVETVAPTKVKTVAPTMVETVAPTKVKTVAPSKLKTVAPSKVKTVAPTKVETVVPPEVEAVGPSYPVWDIPQPNRSVVSSFKDFQWTYPTITNQTEYANKRYVKNEFDTCTSRRHLCCAVGGTSAGGGQVSNGCGFRMDYMAEFEPIPKRPLFSLVDMLLAWRLQHPNATSFQMLFIGDSVTGQVFVAAVCELARNSKVKSFTFDSPAEVPVNFTSFRTSLSFQESHVTLLGHEDFDFTLLFVRQFQLTSNAKAVSLFLNKADVILFGWGLHYVKRSYMFPPALDRVFGELQRHPQPRTLLWFGAPKQHFRYSLNDTQVDGLHRNEDLPVTFCGPVARFPIAQSHSINDFAFDYLTKNLTISASWFKWNDPIATTIPVNDTMHVHFFPFEELTSPYFRNHVNYNANASIQANDCTHSCGAPNLYEPFWDALYLLSATNKPPPKRFPSGTQHHPQLVEVSNDTVLRTNWIISNLKDEVLAI